MRESNTHLFRISCGLGLAILVTYAYVHQESTDMDRSRLDLLHSLVTGHTFAIDAYHKNTIDKASAGGHYYCDKAPGVVFVALPGFFLASRILLCVNTPIDSPAGWHFSSWFCAASSVAVISALGAICLFLWLQHFARIEQALLGVAVFSFGSLVFPYATTLLSHSVTAGLIAIALWSSRVGWVKHELHSARPKLRDLLAGAAFGLAVSSEYDSALIVLTILVVVATANRQKACVMALASIPPLSLIPAYNWITMGNPLSLPYGHEVVFTEMHKGFYGIHAPRIDNAVQLLTGSEHGLFFWTPFFLMAFVGYPIIYAKSRALFCICYLAPILHILIISGYFLITGGSTLGPRFLAPLIPVLILPAVIGGSRAPQLAVLLAILSIAETTIATLVDVRVPVVTNPFVTYYMKQFVAGNFAKNLGQLCGLRGFASLFPLGFIWVLAVGYVASQSRKLGTIASEDNKKGLVGPF